MSENTFTMTEGQRAHVAKCLRHINDARKTLAAKGSGNEVICSELQKSAAGIIEVMNWLEPMPNPSSN
jgi:hypothetical protein